MTLVRENSVQQINAALQSIQRELEMLKMSKNNVPTEEIESIQTSMRALGFSVGNVIPLSDFCNAIANKYGEGQYTIYFSSSVNDSNVITDGTNNIRLADVYVIGYFCSMMDSWKLSEFTIVTASSRQDVWQGVCRTAENPNEPYSKLFQTFSSATTRVNSVNGKTGTVILNASDVGALPSSTVIPAAQVNSDWNASSGVAAILNKPSLATVATSGNYNDLSNKPTIPTVPVDSVNGKTGAVELTATDVGALPDTTHIPVDPVQADWDETDNTKLDYIKNKPTIPAAQVNSDWNASSGVAEILNKPNLATVATSGDYNDLSNKPTIPTVDNSIASGNMNAVTSNAVALAISEGIKRKWTETSAPVTGTNASNITWTCIETNGGLKICFGRATAIRSSSPTGNIFYSAGSDEQWYYPSNFFTATPTCLMEASGGSQWILTYTQPQGADKTKTKKVCPACSTAFTNLTIYYDIAAFGV
jgi:hypothetical protein